MTSDSPYPAPTFVPPVPHGFVYAGFSIDPPTHAPVVRRSGARDDAARALLARASELEASPHVVTSTVFRAVLMPPITNAPRFDLVLLVRTTTPDSTAEIRAGLDLMHPKPDSVITAVNTQRIGDTDADMSSTFLLNHLAATDADRATAGWKSLAGWYTTMTGIDNSTLLEPSGDTPYAVINYARLPHGAVRFLADQFRRRSFVTHVRRTLGDNGITAMPLFYKVARDGAADEDPKR